MARHILGNIIHIAYLLTCVESIYVIKLSLRIHIAYLLTCVENIYVIKLSLRFDLSYKNKLSTYQLRRTFDFTVSSWSETGMSKREWLFQSVHVN